MPHAPKPQSRWIPSEGIPEVLKTERFVTEPLQEKHAALDFEALMSCRERLREELQWGDWPPQGFTLEANRRDLAGHYEEFVRGEAFAYTVLSPSGGRCLGCIYIEQCTEIDGAQLAFWVIDEAMDLEATLVTEVVQWMHSAWRLERVLLPLRAANTRGIALVRECGYVACDKFEEGALAEHFCFLSDGS